MKGSQDIYQKEMDQVFGKCQGAFTIADDIQVYSNDTNYDMYLKQWKGLDKLGSRWTLIKVLSKLSHVLSLVMFTPHREWCQILKKVKAIKQMRVPQTKQELQSCLGTVNYLGQFIKDISQLIPNIRLWVKKNCFILVDRKPWSYLPEDKGEYKQWHIFDVPWYF